ncbi:ComF family protein [Candidatus Cardinium hertigii]|uniref:ComF family protein n=1 Tax=Candidatus Cardinium hertigii TaxID=247481 RepID=UPI003D7E9DFD
MKTFIARLLDLLFPPICVGCNDRLVQGETLICTICFNGFPETDSHTLIDNVITNHFVGKASITYGFTGYRLRKKSRLEQVLFAMKYKNQPKIGYLFGQRYGSILDETPIIQSMDAIVAVPLHPKRLKERGTTKVIFLRKGFLMHYTYLYMKDV